MYKFCANNSSICYVSGINREILKRIGSEVRIRREALSYSQNDIANMTGLTVNTIFALESGKGATLNNFLLICRALKTQPKDFFSDDIDLTPLYPLPPSSKHRIDITQRLDELISSTDFFDTPRRVSEVIEELESDPRESNKFSVYLTTYCKEGALEYKREGHIKRYVKKK